MTSLAARWGLPLVLGIAAAAIRLFAVWKLLPHPFDSENFRAGVALARTGVLADPYALPTGATAHVAPAYPALIALMVRVTGDPIHGMLALRSLLALLFGGFVASLPRVADAMGLGRRAGIIAALAFLPCGAPIFLSIEATGQSETPLAMMAFFVVVTTTIVMFRMQSLRPGHAVTIGLAWGLAGLVSPVILPAFPLTCAIAFWTLRSSRRTILRFSLLAGLSAALALAPWTFRNARALDAVVLVRDNLGLELGVSNADDASADMSANMRSTMRTHPFLSFAEAAKVQREGEVAYNTRRGREALAWMRANPARATTLMSRRLELFFFPGPARQHHAAFYAAVLSLAAVGFALLVTHDRFIAMALGGTVICVMIPYAFVQSSPRYSYPILWILVLVASWGGSAIVDRLREWLLPATARVVRS